MEKTEKKTVKGKARVFWLRLELEKTVKASSREHEARKILQDVYLKPCVKDVQMVSDVGLINLIGAGIQEAFTDAAEGGEEGGEA